MYSVRVGTSEANNLSLTIKVHAFPFPSTASTAHKKTLFGTPQTPKPTMFQERIQILLGNY
jgi:hypothetical protein